MAHYVLLYQGSSPTPPGRELIERSPEVRIVDETAPSALLVDASHAAAERLRGLLTDWLVAEEVTHPPPGPARQSPR